MEDFCPCGVPKNENQAAEFLQMNPTYDGRGVVVAIFDTGVDPRAAGLQQTSDGKPKIIDIIDASGSGDVDMTTVVEGTPGSTVKGLSGRDLILGSDWSNPSGKVRLGIKRAYELYPQGLKGRLNKERQERFEAEQAKAVLDLQRAIEEWETANPEGKRTPEQKKEKQDLDAKLAVLQEFGKKFEDAGPIFDCVLFHDGNVWRAVVDTHETGDLRAYTPMCDYKIERQYSTFSGHDLLSYCVNVYSDGDILSIVTDAGAHGTHVAGIVAANFPENPAMNGIAPGAQIIGVKIGDSRLGSMETGTSMVRALIAVKQAGADMINMSYGESSAMPNSGRFPQLSAELVNKHNVIFVASAGNNGPALSSVGAPGGMTSELFGIGAYVSPSMMATDYSMRETTDGKQYTWSSRGPGMDGALGVCVSSMGGAITSVPAWTLAKKQLMNGTSMSSPSACGAISLLVSALKQNDLPYTPHIVRRAIQNTARRYEGTEIFAQGHGLLQVGAAWEYLQKFYAATPLVPLSESELVSVEEENVSDVLPEAGEPEPDKPNETGAQSVSGQTTGGESSSSREPPHLSHFSPSTLRTYRRLGLAGVRYDIECRGKASYKGIYLRDFEETNRPLECPITVRPIFHDCVDNAVKTTLERNLSLSVNSTDANGLVVSAPKGLILLNGERSFNVRVDPTSVEPGSLCFVEVVAHDLDAPELGPLFRVPITVVKPRVLQTALSLEQGETAEPDSPTSSLRNSELVDLTPGHIKRFFIRVPLTANACRVKVTAVRADTQRTFVLHCVQLMPQKPYDVLEVHKMLALSGGEDSVQTFKVIGGVTMELVIAQFWSSLGNSSVAVDVEFRSLDVGAQALHMNHTDRFHRVDVRSGLRTESFVPTVTLTTFVQVHRPVSNTQRVLKDARDQMFDGRFISELVLEYKFSLTENFDARPLLPVVGEILYESPLEAQFVMTFNGNKKLLLYSDYKPKTVKLTKGDYVVRVLFRHDKSDVLEKLKDYPLHLECTLPVKKTLSAYPELKNGFLGGSKVDTQKLRVGDRTCFYVASLEDSQLPKDAKGGDFLTGTLVLNNKAASFEFPSVRFTYGITSTGPAKSKDASSKDASTATNGATTAETAAAEPTPQEQLEKYLNDQKIEFLGNLLKKPKTALATFETLAESMGIIGETIVEHGVPNTQLLPLLSKYLKALCDDTPLDDAKVDKIIRASAKIQSLINSDRIAIALGTKADPDDTEGQKQRKEIEKEKDVLVETLQKTIQALMDAKKDSSSLNEPLAQLKKWVDLDDAKNLRFHSKILAHYGRTGLALQKLNKSMADSNNVDKSTAEEQLKLVGQQGWPHLTEHLSRWLLINYPAKYPLL